MDKMLKLVNGTVFPDLNRSKGLDANYITTELPLNALKYKHLKADWSTLEYDTTLPTKIRNIIHHPENTNNTIFTETELKSSIEFLISLLK